MGRKKKKKKKKMMTERYRSKRSKKNIQKICLFWVVDQTQTLTITFQNKSTP
jgi:hypothetical protein